MLPLLFFGFIVLAILVLVGLSQVYPKLTGRAEGEAEQELTGMGPENPKVGKDPDITG